MAALQMATSRSSTASPDHLRRSLSSSTISGLTNYLTRRGVREATTITPVTPMPKPIPISDDVSNAIMGMLDERGIEYSHTTWTEWLDPATKVAHLRDGRGLAFDLFLAVPVHVAPAEGEAGTVAGVLRHHLGDGPVPTPFAGEIQCYIEMGDETIGRVNVNFLSGPAPVADYHAPSLEGAEEQRRFAATRRARWFGIESS
jgi:sulfide:quinone oxidoreductase